ncbi:MAG: Holliday junction resolvase RuvX, partial [Pseudomonadales bacterium]
IKEWAPSRLVVGLPLNMDGTSSDMTRAANKFGRRLTGRYNLPVEMVDERLSTFEAKEQADSPTQPLDGIAAKLILETWLQDQ